MTIEIDNTKNDNNSNVKPNSIKNGTGSIKKKNVNSAVNRRRLRTPSSISSLLALKRGEQYEDMGSQLALRGRNNIPMSSILNSYDVSGIMYKPNSKSCSYCRKLGLVCSNQRPCNSCQSFKINCTMTSPKKKPLDLLDSINPNFSNSLVSDKLSASPNNKLIKIDNASSSLAKIMGFDSLTNDVPREIADQIGYQLMELEHTIGLDSSLVHAVEEVGTFSGTQDLSRKDSQTVVATALAAALSIMLDDRYV